MVKLLELTPFKKLTSLPPTGHLLSITQQRVEWGGTYEPILILSWNADWLDLDQAAIASVSCWVHQFCDVQKTLLCSSAPWPLALTRFPPSVVTVPGPLAEGEWCYCPISQLLLTTDMFYYLAHSSYHETFQISGPEACSTNTLISLISSLLFVVYKIMLLLSLPVYQFASTVVIQTLPRNKRFSFSKIMGV